MDKKRVSISCNRRWGAEASFSTWDRVGCGLVKLLGESMTWGVVREGRVLSGSEDRACKEDDRRGILGDFTIALDSRV